MTWHKLLDTVAKKHGFKLTIFDTHEIYRYSCAFWKKELDSDDLSLVTSGAVFRKKKDAYLDLVRIWLKDDTISSLAEAQMKLVARGDLQKLSLRLGIIVPARINRAVMKRIPHYLCDPTPLQMRH